MLTDPIAITALFVAFFAVLAAGPRVIARLHVMKYGQNINTDTPGHQHKQGTPTMGGVMFIVGVAASLVVACLMGRSLVSRMGPLLAVTLVFLAHAVIGFLDDYLSIKRGKSLGLKARHKIFLQVIVAAAFLIWLAMTASPGLTTTIFVGRAFNLGPFYYVVALLLMIGMSNSTNLADGLDGLAGGLAVPVAFGLAWTINPVLVGYSTVGWFAYSLAGACLGFLWFNAHPAKIFMGDTGSLALGGAFAAMAIVDKQEALLLILALVYLAEMLSVVIQVGVFKATGGKPNGRRVFKMAPLHHHFELIGWPETQVVARFCIIGVLALAVGLLLYGQFGW